MAETLATIPDFAGSGVTPNDLFAVTAKPPRPVPTAAPYRLVWNPAPMLLEPEEYPSIPKQLSPLNRPSVIQNMKNSVVPVRAVGVWQGGLGENTRADLRLYEGGRVTMVSGNHYGYSGDLLSANGIECKTSNTSNGYSFWPSIKIDECSMDSTANSHSRLLFYMV